MLVSENLLYTALSSVYPHPALEPEQAGEIEMNAFLETNRNLLIYISLGLGGAAFIAAVALMVQVSRLKKPFREMADLHREIGTEKSLQMLLKGVDENREFMRAQADDIKVMLERLEGCLTGIGMVHYNAFEDIGGNQSYSICILDSRSNGLMLTNLVGRNSARGYAIEVSGGNPSRELGDEEKEALAYALRSIEG